MLCSLTRQRRTRPSLTSNDSAVTHVFSLVVTDDDGTPSAAENMTITINPPANAAPTAEAGAAQTVTSGTEITLAGSGSDTDGTIATYSWTRTGGTGDASNAVLSDATAQNPTFTDGSLTSNDTAVTHTFALVVTDDDGATSVADSVTITIDPAANALPTANAGAAQTVNTGDEVTLAGSGADTDGTIASYSWTRTGGTGDASNAVLSDVTVQSPTFTDGSLTSNDSAVTHVFSLVVTDDDGAASVADSVTITINPAANAVPTAEAGADQTVASGDEVTLAGSGSDTDGTIASYSWTRTGGTGDASNAVLSDAVVEAPTFTDSSLAAGDAAVTHIFELVVTDDDGAASVADSVTITISPPEDTTAPITPSANVNTNPDGSTTVSGTAEPSTLIRVTFPDGSVKSATAAGDGSYSLTSDPGQPSGEVTIVSIDAAGNESTALAIVHVAEEPITGPTVEEIQTQIATYMQARVGHAINAQPDLIGFLSGRAGNFNATVTRSNGNFDFATSGTQPVWARLQGNWSTSDGTENSYFFGASGAHVSLNANALIGFMLQVDRLVQENGGTRTEGDGYLLGPYVVAKLPEHPLYLEGRYLIGKTENSTSIDGAAAQEFGTDRTLASIKIAGQLDYAGLTLTPSLSATRMEETQEAFIDNNSNAVPQQGVTVRDVAIGLDFAKPLSAGQGDLVLTGGIAGVWSEVNGEGFASVITPAYEGQRGRVHLGATYSMRDGMQVSAGANYDGLGAQDYENWGIQLGFNMKF